MAYKLFKTPADKKLEEAKKKLEGKANQGPTKQKAVEIKTKNSDVQSKKRAVDLLGMQSAVNSDETYEPYKFDSNIPKPLIKTGMSTAERFTFDNKVKYNNKRTELKDTPMVHLYNGTKLDEDEKKFLQREEELYNADKDEYYNGKSLRYAEFERRKAFDKAMSVGSEVSETRRDFLKSQYDVQERKVQRAKDEIEYKKQAEAKALQQQRIDEEDFIREREGVYYTQKGRSDEKHPSNFIDEAGNIKPYLTQDEESAAMWYQMLTPAEREDVDFWWGYYGRTEAGKRMSAIANARFGEKMKEASKENAGVRNIIAPATNFMSDLAGGLTYGSEVLEQGFKNARSGIPENVPEWSIGSQMQRLKQDSREAFINGDEGVVGKVKGLGLDTVNSFAPAAFGPAAPFIYGMKTGSDAAYQTVQKGGSNNQAIGMFLANAPIGYLASKGPFDELFKGSGAISSATKKAIENGAKGAAFRAVAEVAGKHVLKQASLEGLEELAENYAYTLSDCLINSDNSDMAIEYNTLLNTGKYTEDQARQMVLFNKIVKEPALSAAYGALMGGLMAGVNITTSAVSGVVDANKRKGGVSSIYNGVEVNEKTTAKDVLEQLNIGNPDAQFDEEYAQGVLDAARGDMEAIPEGTRKMMDFYSKFANVRFVVGDTDVIAGQKAAGAYVNSADVILLDFDTVQDSNEVARKIVNHELTHSAERSRHYDALKEYAFGHMFNESNTLDSAIAKKIDRYGKRGVTLDTTGAEAELVAEYMGKLMSSPEAVEKMVMENKPLAKSVLDSLVETYKKVTTYFKDKDAYEARYALSDIEQGIRLFEKALKTRTSVSDAIARGMGIDTRAMGESDGGVQYTFTPKVDGDIVAKAEKMEADGKDQREIWKELKIGRGLDGEWRREIDDSGAVFSRKGDLIFAEDHPDYKEYSELKDAKERHMLGLKGGRELTANEEQRFADLANVWSNTFKKNGRVTEDAGAQDKLSAYLKHDELYEEYPHLKDLTVVFDDAMEKGNWGQYNRQNKTITLNPKQANSDMKRTLLHEVMHAIQDYEGLARGSSVDYWVNEKRGAERARRVLNWINELKETSKENPDVKDALELNSILREEYATRNLNEFIPNGEIQGEAIQKYYSDSAIKDLQDKVSYFGFNKSLSGRDTYDLYRNTAGEIEARDVSSRADMSAEQRAVTFPESMKPNEDVVFADGQMFGSLTQKKIAELEKCIWNLNDANIKKNAGDKKIKILVDKYSVNKAIHSKKGRNAREVNARIKAIPDFAKILSDSKYSHTETDITDTKKDAKKYVIAMHYFETTYNGFDVEIVVRDKGKRQFLYEVKFMENKKNSQQSMSNDIDSSASKDGVENKYSLSQNNSDVKGDFQFSSPVASADSDVENDVKIKSNKAKNYYDRYVRTAKKDIGKIFSIPGARLSALDGNFDTLAGEYFHTGKISESSKEALFEKAWKESIIIDDTNKDFAKALRKDLKSSTLYISPEDAKDIPDFGVWRRSQLGNMMLSTQSGYSVDSKYQELNAEYGDNYFPLNITAPSDRLMRIAEVMEKLKPLEYTLEEREAEFKEDYRKEFMNGIGEFEKRLEDVSRYEKARALSDVQNNNGRDELTVDEANAIYDELKGLRKNYDKVVAKELLTPADQKKVEQVLAGDIEIEDIKGTKFNVEGIKKVVEAKAPIKLLTDSLERHKNAVKKRRFETAEKFLKGSDLWKEKKFGVSYAAETMERNFYDIMGKGSEKQAKELIDHYFTPVHEHEAQSIRNKNNYRQRVANLGLSQKIEKGNKTSESFAVQFLGEVESDLEMLTKRKYISEKAKAKINELKKQKEIFLRENPNLDYNKINSAIAEFRTIYDELFVEMNGARIRNGYAPVEYRQGYFPHFLTDTKKGINKELAQELGIGEYEAKGGIFEKFTKALGISTDVNNLPTNIAGKTQDFKPGIKFMGEALQRKTDETDYDALAGFDRYIESVSDVIYHTDDIQELRALERQLRYEYSEAGVKERIDALRDDATLPEDVKNDALEKLYERNITKHGGLVQEISEYTNLLANKKSKYDRTIEGLLNRKVYNVLNWANKNVAGNMIAGNLSSAMTNVIPITQASAECSQASIIKAMRDTVKNYLHNDGFEDASVFLTNRRGSDLLTKSTSTKISDALSIPMEFADMFTANVVTRAKFYENIKNGMDADAAIKDADKYAAGLIADRSKGALPTVFGAKNPIAKTFTMFQVEVNNQYGYLLKDMPRAKRSKAVGAIAGALLKYFIGAYLFNDIYEKFVGRRPALDAIGFANEISGDFFGRKFANSIDVVSELIKGEFGVDTWFEKVEKKQPSEALANIASNVAEDTPFIGGLMGGGRVPISSALPDVAELSKLLDSDVSGKKKKDIALKEGSKALYGIVPFGLNQAKKTYQGISTVKKGGSYSINNKGEKQLQYPVFNDTTKDTVLNYAQGALFGKSALPEAQKWRKNGFKSMSVKDTERYEKVAEKGKREETYKTLKQIGDLESIKGADGELLESESKQRYELIKNANIPEGQKAWLEISYWGDKAKARADAAKSEAGISDKRYVDAKYKYAETDAEKYNPYLTKRQKKMFELTPEEEKTSDYKKFSLFNEKGLTASQKRYLEKDLFGSNGKTDYTDKESFYLSLLSDSQNTKFKATENALGVNAELYYTYLKIAGSGKKDEKKANLQKYGMTPAQANAFYELAIKNRKAGDVHDQTAYANLSPKEQAAYNLLKNFKEYTGMDAAEFSLFVRVASSGKTEKEKIELLRNYSLNGQKLSEIAAKGIVKVLAR